MNELEIQILGMSRSGNHAIADWIFAQAEGSKLLLNCAEGRTNPFLSCRPLAEGRGWRAAPPVDIADAKQGHHADRRLLVHTYEDSWIGYAFSSELQKHRDEWLGPSRRKIAMLILRDPFNLFASRRRMGRNLPPDTARYLWKQHAREALEHTRCLPGERLVVLYNNWSESRAYRQRIAKALGLPFSDSAIDRVASCAGGSSFDGMAFDGKAAAMATDQRWKHFVDDDRFTRFFDEEMIDLSAKLFGSATSDASHLVDSDRGAG